MCVTLSLVIACFNEEDVLHETAKRLNKKIRGMIEQGLINENSRVVFVDDGSEDKTWDIITQLHEDNKLFTGISLSHNSGEQNAYIAGMMAVKESTDIIITMDADLQDDIDAIDEMVNEYYKGNDIVYGVRSSRKKDSFFKRFTSENFYIVMKILGIEIISNHSQYRLMSHRAVEALSGYKEVNLFLPCLVPLLGYKNSIVYYERKERYAGKTKYSARKMFSLAAEAITSFSCKPIKMINLLIVISFFAVIAGIIAMIVQKVQTDIVPSWLFIFTSIWAAGVFQLLAIRIVGEYVGKTYSETKKRPRYIISENLLE